MKKNIEELTLLLMYLTSWENVMAADTIKIRVIDELTNQGYLFPSKYRNKSVTITKEGMEYAEKLLEKYIK